MVDIDQNGENVVREVESDISRLSVSRFDGGQHFYLEMSHRNIRGI